jgi:hypothetical protein
MNSDLGPNVSLGKKLGFCDKLNLGSTLTIRKGNKKPSNTF